MVLRAKYGRAELNAPILQWVKREGFTNVLEAYDKAIKKLKPLPRPKKRRRCLPLMVILPITAGNMKSMK